MKPLYLLLSTAGGNVTLVSAYSHVACRGISNLNQLLHKGGFLELESEGACARAEFGRIEAARASSGGARKGFDSRTPRVR